MKNRDLPSVFKIPKLKLGHFWIFLPPPPLLGHCPKLSQFSILTPHSSSLILCYFCSNSSSLILDIENPSSSIPAPNPPLFISPTIINPNQKLSPNTFRAGHFRLKWMSNYFYDRVSGWVDGVGRGCLKVELCKANSALVEVKFELS